MHTDKEYIDGPCDTVQEVKARVRCKVGIRLNRKYCPKVGNLELRT